MHNLLLNFSIVNSKLKVYLEVAMCGLLMYVESNKIKLLLSAIWPEIDDWCYTFSDRVDTLTKYELILLRYCKSLGINK